MLLTIRIGDVAKVEGDSGTKIFSFTVLLSTYATNTVTVQYATADGTARAGVDYVAQSGTLTFYKGQIFKTISIVVIGDTVYEPNETFYVNLFNPVGATL